MFEILHRLRRLWEDKARPVYYPGHYSRGDAVLCGRYYRIVQEPYLTLNTAEELCDWVMFCPKKGTPPRQEMGWTR